ncbi:MAG: hypothetical protein A2X46_15595 [Lentisphaerae bacterium GWF2_57_35]|nr:MAG: hypothetical protein A2X46_15595 [Lentisphaerae bacterium GWF2_57_35]
MRLIVAMRIFLLSVIISTTIIAETSTTNDNPKIASAKDVFNQYVTLSNSFDASVIDLYSDNAFIQNTRIYPDGRRRALTMSAQKYKQLIRCSMPLAKQRGDTDTYRDVSYAVENGNVRIKAIRHNNMKDYDSPISILVAESGVRKWLIVEEITESKP